MLGVLLVPGVLGVLGELGVFGVSRKAHFVAIYVGLALLLYLEVHFVAIYVGRALFSQ